jgi:hypothetical protein
VSPARRRRAVEHLQRVFGVSQRWACRLVGQHRSTQRHQPVEPDRDRVLRQELRRFSRAHPRWGYRRAHAQLRSQGWVINRKAVQRRWREEGLRVPTTRRKRQRLGTSTCPAARLAAEHPDHVWALDYQFDQTLDGRILKLLNVVDEHTREALTIQVNRRIDADATVAVLDRLVARSLTFGHPLAVVDPEDEPPDLDFGPLINAAKVTELHQEVDLAIQMAATPLFRSSLQEGWFLPGQDTSAYLPPVALLDPPGASALGHAEPFGPVDTVVLVDSPAELVAEMNASNGCLVASIACDNERLARRLADQVHAFKVGINAPRSRGDKAEPFGGRGASWKGAFVGGQFLVHAVTQGPPDEQLYGNFPDYQRYPPA